MLTPVRAGAVLRLLQFCIMQNAVDGTQIPELKDVVSLALEEAQRRGATQCEVGREP